MTNILIKSIDEITRSDIDSLITSKVVESDRIEFKRELPSSKKGFDSWSNGKLSDKAKKVILDVVVAFANAKGGSLVLGIDESDSNPPTASKIVPISGCNDLAESLKMVFRDCVEPQLPNLEILPVETECANHGVVILRTGKSSLAPHRNRLTMKCTIRRLNRVDEMTMQEIRNMAINTSEGLNKMEKIFKERSKKFHKDLNCFESPAGKYGVRMTAAPVMEGMRFSRVFRGNSISSELSPEWCEMRFNIEPSRTLGFPTQFPLQQWQPILRGARAETAEINEKTNYFGYQEIHSNGLVEHGFLGKVLNKDQPTILPPDWFVTMFANLLIWGDRIRRQGNEPNMEYTVQVETYNSAEKVHVTNSYSPFTNPILRKLKYPDYPFNHSNEISGLTQAFYRDLWNSLGIDGDFDKEIFTILDSPL